jgi:hypothetical protein
MAVSLASSTLPAGQKPLEWNSAKNIPSLIPDTSRGPSEGLSRVCRNQKKNKKRRLLLRKVRPPKHNLPIQWLRTKSLQGGLRRSSRYRYYMSCTPFSSLQIAILLVHRLAFYHAVARPLPRAAGAQGLIVYRWKAYSGQDVSFSTEGLLLSRNDTNSGGADTPAKQLQVFAPSNAVGKNSGGEVGLLNRAAHSSHSAGCSQRDLGNCSH